MNQRPTRRYLIEIHGKISVRHTLRNSETTDRLAPADGPLPAVRPVLIL